MGSTSCDLEVEIEENVDGLEVLVEANIDSSPTLVGARSLIIVDNVLEAVLLSVDTRVEEEGVLFPPPNTSTSSPITLVTQISGLFGLDVRLSSSPVLHGGLLGKEYEFEKQGREYC